MLKHPEFMTTSVSMLPKSAVLQADALCFAYAESPANRLFDGLSVTLLPGVTLLTGDESCGKTSLLKLLAGTLPATGELHIEGVSLAQDRSAYQRQVAWLDPLDTALNAQTARQIFTAQALSHTGWEAAALQAHIEGLSLTPHLDKTLDMLSTGSRRKVLLAATLAAGCAVTLLDQPFMALDRPSIDYLAGVLRAAATQADRAYLVADYEAPYKVPLAAVIRL